MRPWLLFVLAASLVACGNATSANEGVPTIDAADWDVALPEPDVSFPPSTPGPSGLQLGPTVIAARPPPAISGGTLIVARDGRTAIAADPDRDRVFFVDVVAGKLIAEVALNAGDEPGRVIEDDAGRVHVVLRSAGAIASIDLATHTVVARTTVCPVPRGIAFDAEKRTIMVACAGGELVLDALGAKKVVQLDRDLRDIVVSGKNRWVTRFRSAEILKIDAEGRVLTRTQPALLVGETSPPPFVPAVAFRAIPHDEGVIVVHQRANRGVISTFSGGYLGRCGPVHSTVSVIGDGTPLAAPAIEGAVLPVDVALSPDRKWLAVVATGGARVVGGAQLFRMPLAAMTSSARFCSAELPGLRFAQLPGQATAIAFAPAGQMLIQSREPAQLMIDDRVIALSSVSRFDTGHQIFHSSSGALGSEVRGGIACASCHPEGGDDGFVWDFDKIGRRRTQTFRGGLTGTEPFHWDGSLADLTALTTEVFHQRMGGPRLEKDQVAALARYLDAIPTLPHAAPSSTEAVSRGKALFVAEAQGCATCHVGPRFTNNATVDVGTGGKLQVPSLVGVAWHAPFMHDGCAWTLAERFSTKCGGGDQHGKTSHLGPAQIADLVAYLESL